MTTTKPSGDWKYHYQDIKVGDTVPCPIDGLLVCLLPRGGTDNVDPFEPVAVVRVKAQKVTEVVLDPDMSALFSVYDDGKGPHVTLSTLLSDVAIEIWDTGMASGTEDAIYARLFRASEFIDHFTEILVIPAPELFWGYYDEDSLTCGLVWAYARKEGSPLSFNVDCENIEFDSDYASGSAHVYIDISNGRGVDVSVGFVGSFDDDAVWQWSVDSYYAQCREDWFLALSTAFGTSIWEIADGLEEPPAPDEVYPTCDQGYYALVYDSAGEERIVVDYYEYLYEAEAVAAQHNRELKARHRGDLLCGYNVVLRDELEDDEDDNEDYYQQRV